MKNDETLNCRVGNYNMVKWEMFWKLRSVKQTKRWVRSFAGEKLREFVQDWKFRLGIFLKTFYFMKFGWMELSDDRICLKEVMFYCKIDLLNS